MPWSSSCGLSFDCVILPSIIFPSTWSLIRSRPHPIISDDVFYPARALLLGASFLVAWNTHFSWPGLPTFPQRCGGFGNLSSTLFLALLSHYPSPIIAYASGSRTLAAPMRSPTSFKTSRSTLTQFLPCAIETDFFLFDVAFWSASSRLNVFYIFRSLFPSCTSVPVSLDSSSRLEIRWSFASHSSLLFRMIHAPCTCCR